MAWFRVKADVYYEDDPVRVEYLLVDAESFSGAAAKVEDSIGDHLEGISIEWVEESGLLFVNKQVYEWAGEGFPLDKDK